MSQQPNLGVLGDAAMQQKMLGMLDKLAGQADDSYDPEKAPPNRLLVDKHLVGGFDSESQESGQSH